jgi:hypothetical protein
VTGDGSLLSIKKSGQKIFRESQLYSEMGINGGRERGYTLWEGDPHPLIVLV